MFLSKKTEDVSQKHDLTIQELMIRIDGLDREIKTLLDELQVSPTQISKFISEESNFTPENWEELQVQRARLDEKLSRELRNVRNPKKTQEALASSQHVARHWIFVR